MLWGGGGSYDISHTLTVSVPGMVEVLWGGGGVLRCLTYSDCRCTRYGGGAVGGGGSYDVSHTLTVSVPGMVEVLWGGPMMSHIL